MLLEVPSGDLPFVSTERALIALRINQQDNSKGYRENEQKLQRKTLEMSRQRLNFPPCMGDL